MPEARADIIANPLRSKQCAGYLFSLYYRVFSDHRGGPAYDLCSMAAGVMIPKLIGCGTNVGIRDGKIVRISTETV